ncbi:MAG: HD domain-containing phosphohydrolase [Terracidiphilus sp.]
MKLQIQAFVCVVVAGAGVCLYSVPPRPAQNWIHFLVYLAAILLSSGMKVAMPKSGGTMSVNFPFILLGIAQLSPLQAIALAVASVIAQCRFNVIRPFTLIQIVFNVANVIIDTVLAYGAFNGSLGLVHRQVTPALAIAATVYFVANTACLTVVLAWESGISPLQQWIKEFPWYFPFYLVGAVLAALGDFIGNRFGWLTSMLLIPMVYTVYRVYRAQMATIRDREQHIVEIQALQLRTIEGLAMAIEAKDCNTHCHLLRVRVYVSEMGQLIGLDPIQMQALVAASYLHDIGKLAVPEHIINKPGKLTPEEFEKMKIHPVVGADILERVRFPYPVVPIVRSHHEAWDGSGYPDGLKGEEIPIGARILTAVDCFDALASERPYRKALPLDEAIAVVRSKAGSQFDPQIVRLLEDHYHELEKRARQAMEDMPPPLNTDLFIERGAAPGAGFEQESDVGRTELFKESLSQSPLSLMERGNALHFAMSDEEKTALLFQQLHALIDFDCVAIYCKIGTDLHVRLIHGPCKDVLSEKPIPLGQGISGWVAEYSRPIINGNPTVEPNLKNDTGVLSADSSAISIPLLGERGGVFAVLTLYSRRSAAYSKLHLAILERIGAELSRLLDISPASENTPPELGGAPGLTSCQTRSFVPIS